MVAFRLVVAVCLGTSAALTSGPAAATDHFLGDFAASAMASIPHGGAPTHARRPIPIGADNTIYRPAAEPFSIFVIPDTQGYADGGCYDNLPCFEPAAFTAQTRYLRRYYDHPDNNAIFVAHLGDVVDDAGRRIEWVRARRAMRLLDSFRVGAVGHHIPYGIAPGNHDFVSWRDGRKAHRAFNRAFSLAAYKQRNPRWRAWLSATRRGRRNSLYRFAAGGDRYLILFLEYCPDNATIAWASRALARHAKHRGVVVTHAATDRHGRWFRTCQKNSQHAGRRGNSGHAIWRKLVATSPNVHFVLGGHAGYGLGWNAWRRKYASDGQLTSWWKKHGWDGGTYARKRADDGHVVHVLISNYQHMYRADNGLFRRMKFYPERDEVEVLTYSPRVRRYLRDLDPRCGKLVSGSEGALPCNSFRLRYEMSGP